MRKLLLAAAVWASACAPKLLPAPVVTTPKYPDFVRPAIPEAQASSAAAINVNRGWAFLQSGDLKTAEHELHAALRNDPRFTPAEASLGYLELARKDVKAALERFDTALGQRKDDVASLVGRGQTLLAMERDGDALVSFEAALAVDPDQPEVRRRVDVLKFRGVEQGIARAREAAQAGRLDEAVSAYEAALAGQPESPFLYRELAAVERRQEKPDQALDHFRKAAALDPSDLRSRVQIAEILESREDFEAALQAYTDAVAVERTPEIEAKIDAINARLALAKLPAEYRAIEQAPQLTRADLAALIGVRLAPLLEGASRPDASLITDVRASWALPWIMAVARAGVMEPLPNHQFQPRGLVRRSELAQASARLLSKIGAQQPEAARAWDNARLRFSDLAPGHLAYAAASAAVAAGVMATVQDTAFQPGRPVTGAEAASAIAKLESLAGLR